MTAKTPHPPVDLPGVLNDPVHASSGKLLSASPIVPVDVWEEVDEATLALVCCPDENDTCPYAHCTGTCMDGEIRRLTIELNRARGAIEVILPWCENWLPDEAKDQGAREAYIAARAALADEPRKP